MGIEGVSVGSVVFLGGVFGLICGFVFSFIESKIEPRVWRIRIVQPRVPAYESLHRHKKQRSSKTTQETMKE
jgi:hypothetical protein